MMEDMPFRRFIHDNRIDHSRMAAKRPILY